MDISVMNNVSTIGKLIFNLNVFKSLDIQNMYIIAINCILYKKWHAIISVIILLIKIVTYISLV